MHTFGRRAIGNVISMTNAERLAHVDHYRCRARELKEMRRIFPEQVPETLASIAADITAFDRMAWILGDSLAQGETPTVVKLSYS